MDGGRKHKKAKRCTSQGSAPAGNSDAASASAAATPVEPPRDANSEVVRLVADHEHLRWTKWGKVHCILTGHDMPKSDVGRLQTHLASSSYKLAVEYSRDYSHLEPYVTEDKKDPKRKLFCHLTKTVLNKISDQVERHVNGKKFKRLHKEAEEAKARREERERRRAEKLKARRERRELEQGSFESGEHGSGDGSTKGGQTRRVVHGTSEFASLDDGDGFEVPAEFVE